MRRYEISKRELDGWWKLTMYQDDEEMGGGVFPPTDDGYQDAQDTGNDWAGGGE